jgi:hypothetical protein
MIQRSKLLEEFEKQELRKPSPGYAIQLRIFEALFQEAQSLGVFPLKNPLEGIESDIQLARALNVRKTS